MILEYTEKSQITFNAILEPKQFYQLIILFKNQPISATGLAGKI
jgi:hypothetical protein